MLRKALVASGVVAAFALGGGVAHADATVDVQAWVQQHKAEIEFFAAVDIDNCEGLKGLSYEGAASMADARNIDLDSLVKKADADQILRYIHDHGITLKQLSSLVEDFCQGDIPVPPVVTDPPESPSPTDVAESPSTPESSAPVAEPPSAVKPTPDATDEPVSGSLAKTGGMSPWLPIGGSAALIGSGLGLVALKRRGVL